MPLRQLSLLTMRYKILHSFNYLFINIQSKPPSAIIVMSRRVAVVKIAIYGSRTVIFAVIGQLVEGGGE